MRKEQLDNLTKGTRPLLHASTPNWDTLKGLVERAADGLSDAKKKANSSPTRFAAAYSSAFWLARAALEACYVAGEDRCRCGARLRLNRTGVQCCKPLPF